MVSSIKNTYLPALAFSCFIFAVTAPAVAQLAEGCDPEVFDAMTSTVNARIAYSAAIDDEVFGQPDSVLALTCFNQLASISANMGGIRVFSDNFVTELNDIMEPTLEGLYGNFQRAPGYTSGAVDYSGTSITAMLGSEYECAGAANLWDQSSEEGINANVPYVTFRDLREGSAGGGAPPAGTVPGSRFEASWTEPATQATFDQLRDDMQVINQGDYREEMVPSFASATTPCEVLQALNSDIDCS